METYELSERDPYRAQFDAALETVHAQIAADATKAGYPEGLSVEDSGLRLHKIIRDGDFGEELLVEAVSAEHIASLEAFPELLTPLYADRVVVAACVGNDYLDISDKGFTLPEGIETDHFDRTAWIVSCADAPRLSCALTDFLTANLKAFSVGEQEG